jgi:hypothetical protein
MSDRALLTLPSTSRAAISTSPLLNTPSESGHDLNGGSSSASRRSAATASTQPTSDVSGLGIRQPISSQSSASGSPIELALTGETHNGETNENSPWARKTILSLGTLLSQGFPHPADSYFEKTAAECGAFQAL